MAWIKRNLFFVIGCLVAVGLMGWAVWYLYLNLAQNEAIREQLAAQYAEMANLQKADPHPGDGKKLDNIKLAQEQQLELAGFIKKGGKYFARIPAIPDTPKVASEDFGRQLRNNIDQLSRDATNASVALPPRYNFTFEAQKNLMTFASGSLEPLAVKLGEIKAICDILFRARINSLDSLRRERVSKDDSTSTAGASDYLEHKPVTNELAVLNEYEVTFRSFSSELAAVMEGLATSPHCFIVKTINVEPAPALAAEAVNPFTPTYNPTPYPQAGGKDFFRERYGLKPPTPQVLVAPPPTTSRGGLPTVLNETQVKVILRIEIVKLREDRKDTKPKTTRPPK